MGGFSTSLPEIMWFVAGLVLILMEFAVPGVILVFFGIGAWIVAILVYLDLLTSLTSQLFVYSAASIVLIVALRKWVKDKFYGHITGAQDLTHNLDDFAGHRVTVLADVIPGKAGGLVEFKGSDWRATSDEEIKKGETATVIKNEGLTLIIKR
jgi:membrane protein implicated in regulation of membrane protease activity